MHSFPIYKLFIFGMFLAASPVLAAAEPAEYTNPVCDRDMPDPSVLRADDGYYYVYATETERNLPIYRSRNLVDWERCGFAFTDQTHPNVVEKANIWAPDVSRIGDKYVMHYSMSVWGGEWTCGIGSASADSPAGPFTDHGKMFISNGIGIRNCIDPFYIEDGGRKYLFFGSFHGIYAVELTDDGLKVRQGTPVVKVAGSAYEGTYIHRRDGYYYLFASTGTCCEGLKSTYATVVGRSDRLLGPYTDRQGRTMLKNFHEGLIQRSDEFVGTGHNSEIVSDDAGSDWMLYHAVKTDSPRGRKLLLDRIEWIDGWPTVAGGKPSVKAAAPVIELN